MNGSGEQPPHEDSFGLRAEVSRSEGNEPLRNDVQGGFSSESVFNELALGAAYNAMNHPSSLLSAGNDTLVHRELLSRAIALNGQAGSSPVGSFQVQQNEVTRGAAGLPNVNPSLHQLESRMQLFQGQLDRQHALIIPSLFQQEPIVGSLDLRQIRPSNLLLSIQNQLQADQQQQLQYQSSQGLVGTPRLPGGSSWSPSHSSLAMMSQLGSQINPSLLIQDPSLLANHSSRATLRSGALHQNLPHAATPIQGLEDILQTRRARLNHSAGGARESTFPMKLHRILADPHFQDCICWLPSGKSWRVLNQHVFANNVLPGFFKHQKYASFMRQVNGWGFKRTIQGPDINSYSHELFVRSNPELCLNMRRLKQSSSQNGTEKQQGT